MKNLLMIGLGAALTLFMMVGVVRAAEPLKVGDAAPDFELLGSDGKTYKLSSFKDKKAVVVAWFPKAFTGGCTAECKSLRGSGDEIRKYDVAYFTASCDEPDVNKKFAESLELDYPILSDPTTETAQAYGLVKDGGKHPTRRTFYIGKDGTLLHIDSSVKTGAHGSDIAAKLEELKVAKKP
jgi:peroxiredoxin Q/BCP